MKYPYLVIAFFSCACLSYLPAACQDLHYLPQVFLKGENPDSLTSLVFNTMDIQRVENTDKLRKPYVNSVQIVDANQPWPPRWYTNTPIYTNEMFEKDLSKGVLRFDFLLDVKVEAGYFSFFKSLYYYDVEKDGLKGEPFQGYIMLNKKMEPVDTVISITPNINLYWHDFRINPKGERLISVKVNELLNLSKRTGNPKDSAVKSSVDVIQVVDDNNKVIFSWKATDKLDPEVFQYEQSLSTVSFAKNKSEDDFIDWSHLTSVIWDYDGNILYALRFIGIGKISREDGHVIWKVDYSDIPIISGKDTIEWYLPHDLNFLYETDSSAVYSLYSLGEKPHHRSVAVIFEVNKKTNKISLVKYLHPHKDYRARGQGSCDYYRNGDYIFSYGVYQQPSDTSKGFKDAIEYGNENGPYFVYQLPAKVHSYKAHLLKDWPRPPRPVIVKKGNVLEVTGENMSDWVWYKLTGDNLTEAVQVGTGKKIKPVQGVTYCVEGKYGIGHAVSLPFKN